MKKYVLCLSLLLTSVAYADELADANALFAKKAYPQAMQMYTKLANAGNAEAQLHLGEMYWYGEAGSIDLVKADQWFRKAAAKGNKTAIAALEVMKQRELRRADLDYWISTYDGSDLRSKRCAAPRIPAISKVNEEITRVSSSVEAWQVCYNAYVQELNAASPLSGRIPADIAKLLNQQELDTAKARLDAVHAGLSEEAKVSAKLVLADFGVWRSATEAWVSEHNAIVKGSAERSDAEARKNNYQSPSR